MKLNKLDKSIKEKFENRTLKPSPSAWERLSVQLDEQPQEKKKGWFFYIGIAASILVLVSIGIQVFSDKEEVIIPNKILVKTPIDTLIIKNKIDEIFNEIPVEEAIVKQNDAKIEEEKQEKIFNKNKNIIANKVKQSDIKKKPIKDKIEIAQIDKKETNRIKNQTVITTEIDKSQKSNTLKQDPNSRIKIDSNDLLFAVTRSSQEVKEYYAKHNTNRKEILKTIKSELKKSSIKINPETILAEVERTIDNDDFQNNFMKSLKTKISNIATAIASRND